MNRNKITISLVFAVAVLILAFSFRLDSSSVEFFESVHSSILDLFFSIITNSTVIFLFLVLIPSAQLYASKKPFSKIIMALLAALFLSVILKMIFIRQRPNGLELYSFMSIISYSFPSMHSMVAFSLYPVLSHLIPKQKSFWLLYASLVALSRLYLGVHYLSDVLYGSFIGYLIGIFVLMIKTKEQNEKK